MKVLILGGKPIGTCELVQRAHSRGDYVIVTDYLEASASPAKQIADEAWDVSTADIEALACKCRSEGVGAILAGIHEFNIEKAIELSESLGLSYYCGHDEWKACVDKSVFKRYCRNFGIAVAHEYSENKVGDLGADSFPLVVKPADGSGSRGFSKCTGQSQLVDALKHAREFSLGGKTIIEEFVEGDAVIIHYTAHAGRIVFSGMSDKLSRAFEQGAPIMAMQIAPSRHTARYLSDVNDQAIDMLLAMGIEEGPVWIEAFYRNGEFIFNEMAHRFGGSLSNYMVQALSGIDQLSLMYDFVTAREISACEPKVSFSNKKYVILPIHLRAGVVGKIEGFSEAQQAGYFKHVVFVHSEGDVIEEWGSAQQVMAYLHFEGASENELMERMKQALSFLRVKDSSGRDMLTSLFDPFSEDLESVFTSAETCDTLPCRYYSQGDLIGAWNGSFADLAAALEQGFMQWANGQVILPDKASQIIDEATQDRVNCMPCTLLKEGVSGVKLVSVFPENAGKGIPNVSGIIVLSSAHTGIPMAIMEGSFITALRTALVGGIAARRLARTDSEVIGLLGSGEEARMHLLVMKALIPSIKTCYVASRRSSSEAEFVECMTPLCPDVEIIACDSDWEKAARSADVIVTAISGQVPLLKADWVKPGAFYCHVGGWEDEFAVAEKADKIVCDSWAAVKHRSQTISRMYQQGLLSDSDIYADLAEILLGEKEGRSSDDEFIYFNSVGLAFTDAALAKYFHFACMRQGKGVQLPLQEPSIFNESSFVRKMREGAGGF